MKFYLQDHEELYDERSLSPPPSDHSPLQPSEDHLQQTTYPYNSPYPNVNQRYQQTLSNQNFPEIRGPCSRPHSELSMSVYPSSDMYSSMNQAIRDAYNLPNEGMSRGYSYEPVNYRNNVIPCSLNNYIRNNNNTIHNLENDALHNDVKEGYYQNSWDQHMEMLHRHGTITPPTNIYTPGYHLNNYQRYDNNCLSTAHHQPAYHSVQDGLMYSQNRPVMSSQPHQNRMFFSHQHAIHPCQVYNSSVAQGRLPERCIPFSAQHGNNFPASSSFYNPEISDHRSLNLSNANVFVNNCVQSTKSGEQIQSSKSSMQQNNFNVECQINENSALSSNSLPVHQVQVPCNDNSKHPDSVVSHPTTQKQGKLDSEVQETLITGIIF